MYKINTNPTFNPIDQSYIGGKIPINSLNDWPIDPVKKKPMTPLLTLHQDIFFIPTIPEGMALTVFLSLNDIDPIRNYRINRINNIAFSDAIQYKSKEIIKSKVLLYPVGDLKIHPDSIELPSIGIERVMAEKEEEEKDQEDEFNGVICSKIGGRAGWLQDPIYPSPKYLFYLQIMESDLVHLDRKFNGIFEDGAGYLFIDMGMRKKTKLAVSGEFIVQYT